MSDWIVWYRHWRFHSASIDIRECNDRDGAFSTAQYLEDEADDCVNEVFGIEDPQGTFIDLAEYEAVKSEIGEARWEREKAAWAKDKAAHKRTIIVSGPDGEEYSETWPDEYFDKYHQKLLEQFGAVRVRVVEA